MKIFVATKKSQGLRSSDFSFVPDGETVFLGSPCDRDRDGDRLVIDGRCGCQRSMIGLVCAKSTTTFAVVDDPAMTKEKFVSEFLGAQQENGWPVDKMRAEFTEDALAVLELAEHFKVGDVCEKRGNKIQTRNRLQWLAAGKGAA